MEGQNNVQDVPALQERPVSPSSASENEEEGDADPAIDTSNKSQSNNGGGDDGGTDATNNNPSQENNHYFNSPNEPTSFQQQPPIDQSILQYPMNMPLPYFRPCFDTNHNMHPHQPPPPHYSHPNHALPPFPNFLPPPSLHHPMHHMPQSSSLDATRQFYEQQMREHAMQYANAAAGAAWVAARIAYGDHPMMAHQGPPLHHHHNNALAYVPASAGNVEMLPSSTVGGWSMDPDASSAHVGESTTYNHRQRTLWKPNNPKTNTVTTRKKNESNKAIDPSNSLNKTTTNSSSNNKIQHNSSSHEKKRSKKRESGGNDSVSSLGSGSHRSASNPDSGPTTTNNSTNIHNTTTSHPNNRHNNTKIIQQRNQRQNKRGFYQSYSPRGSSSSLGTLGSTGATSTSNTGNNNNHSNYYAPGRHKRRNTESLPTRGIGAFSSPLSSSVSHVFLGGLIGKSGVSALHELCSKYRWEMPKYELMEDANNRVISKVGGEEGSCGAKSRNNGSLGQDFILSVRVNGVELGRGRGGTKGGAKHDASRKALAALIPGVVFDPNGILLDIGTGLLRIIDENSRSVPTSLEELAPHLASQLAIGVSPAGAAAAAQHTRPSSPDFSEDSSISTAVSMTKSKPEHVILSGLSSSGGFAGSGTNPGIYPSASSASEVDDEYENANKSSEARACSILLHAMWQIDYRIREPPSYIYDLVQINADGGTPLPKDRSLYQCTASLKLYFPKRLVECKESANIMDYWESPLEHSQAKPSALSPQRRGDVTNNNEPSRKRKDSFTSQATPSPTRQLKQEGNNGGEHSSPTAAQEQEEMVPHRIESVGTGSTKRESKHRSSARLLSMLFPECSSMVEVMAAAEAARECYAAKKTVLAQTKRAKLSNGRSFSPPASALAASATNEGYGTKEKEIQPDLLRRLCSNNKSGLTETHDSECLAEGLFGVAGLSLSEPAKDCKRVLCRDMGTKQNEVDIALKSMFDGKEAEESAGFRLRRVDINAMDRVCTFLNASSETGTSAHTQNDEAEPPSSAGPSDIQLNLHNASIAMLLLIRNESWSDDSPPLGFAILELEKERTLMLHAIRHVDHLPKENFMECLDELASTMRYNLDTSSTIEYSESDLLQFVHDHLYAAQGKASEDDDGDLPLSNSHLQSVKEEDNEDVNSEEEANENDLAGRKRSRVD